eukprot:3322704-Amphidinium_carterae.1
MGAACSLYLRPIRGRPTSGQMARTHKCDYHAASSVALHNGVCVPKPVGGSQSSQAMESCSTSQTFLVNNFGGNASPLTYSHCQFDLAGARVAQTRARKNGEPLTSLPESGGIGQTVNLTAPVRTKCHSQAHPAGARVAQASAGGKGEQSARSKQREPRCWPRTAALSKTHAGQAPPEAAQVNHTGEVPCLMPGDPLTIVPNLWNNGVLNAPQTLRARTNECANISKEPFIQGEGSTFKANTWRSNERQVVKHWGMAPRYTYVTSWGSSLNSKFPQKLDGSRCPWRTAKSARSTQCDFCSFDAPQPPQAHARPPEPLVGHHTSLAQSTELTLMSGTVLGAMLLLLGFWRYLFCRTSGPHLLESSSVSHMSKSDGDWTSTKPKRQGGRKDRPFMQGYGSRLSGIDERGRNLAAVTESARRKERRAAEEARSAATAADTTERDTWQSGWDRWSTGWNWDEGADRTQWARPNTEAAEEETTSSWDAARTRERSRSKMREPSQRESSSVAAQSNQTSLGQTVHAAAQARRHTDPSTDSTQPEGVRTTPPPAPDQNVEDPAANFDIYWDPLQANIQSAKLSILEVKSAVHDFYAILHPEGLAHLDAIFAKYKGNEIGLAKSVVRKYTRSNPEITTELFSELLKRARMNAGVALHAHASSAASVESKVRQWIGLALVHVLVAAACFTCFEVRAWIQFSILLQPWLSMIIEVWERLTRKGSQPMKAPGIPPHRRVRLAIRRYVQAHPAPNQVGDLALLASVWKNAVSRKHRSQAQKYFARRATGSLGHQLEQPCVGFLATFCCMSLPDRTVQVGWKQKSSLLSRGTLRGSLLQVSGDCWWI